MKCVICKEGLTKPGTTTITLDEDGQKLVIRSVPGEICERCGEGYFDEPTTERIEQIAERAKRDGLSANAYDFQVA